ncbi:MAG TPA: hypothetical protein VMT90_09870 [Dehalococcoidia bacterium]|jgi:hypothetical protein|nr:hypothetical protein [Dehalococcoidia bacterium]
MGNCTTCGHEFERHLFGGMCFYCDCKRATYDLSAPYGLEPRDARKRHPSRNGTGKKAGQEAPRLGKT